MPDPTRLTRSQFAQTIKVKYPQYAQVPDDQLVTRILDKHPTYRARIAEPEPAPTQTAPQQPQQQEQSFLGEMVSNIPSSAAQFAKDVTAPLHSPIQTGRGVLRAATGVIDSLLPFKQGTEQVPRAIGRHLYERYRPSNIGQTMRTDPVGVAADVAGTLMGGGGLAARAPGMAGRAGRMAAAAGRAVDPIEATGRAVGAAARGTGNVLSEVLGLTTGATAQPIRVAFEAGAQGGEQGRMFLKSARGEIPMDQVVEQARDAVRTMHQQKMERYRQGIAGAFEETADKPINFGEVANNAAKAMGTGTFKGVDISKSTANVRGQIAERLQQWSELDPAVYHTVEGMDALRKSIGDVLESAPFGTPERKLANEVYFAIRKSIEAQAPGYAQVLKGYHEASTHLKDLERALSLGKQAATETALRKLQAVMRQDVTAAYGKRGEYAAELRQAGAGDLDQMLAGQALETWTPRSLASRVGGLGSGAAAASGIISPAALPLILAASPRAVGAGAYRAGQAIGPLAEAIRRVPAGAGQAAFQAGRAGRVGN